MTNNKLSIDVKDLPKPPEVRIGFPWTESSISHHPSPITYRLLPPQYFDNLLPKITIITPSFNQSNYIEETIRSILLQNYPNLEYIIIDGGSTDGTIDIIKKYEKWITYWVSEPDEGQSDAINKGLKQATGDIFNWINSDDLLLPNALNSIALEYKKSAFDVLICRQKWGYNLSNILFEDCTYLFQSIEETICRGQINQQSIFFNVEKIKEIGGVNKNIQFTMDADMWTRFLVHFGVENVVKCEHVVAFFRMQPDSKTSKLNDVYLSDRYNLAANLLVNVSEKYSFLKKNTQCTYYLNEKKDLGHLNTAKIETYASDTMFKYCVQIMDWNVFFKLYFIIIHKYPNRINFRFYVSPIIKLKRIFLPIK